jgi:outer membrane lipoprotein
MKNIVPLALIALLLPGCTYAISPELVKQADKTLSFEQIESAPEQYKGTLVILGGTIASAIRTTDGTMIEVAQRSLDSWGRPLRTSRSGGSFLLLHPGSLDPLLYAPGREITVAAIIDGSRHKGLDEGDHSWPLLLAKELKLWPEPGRAWSRPQYLDPLYDPYASPRYSN